jgi:hypothetical protein
LNNAGASRDGGAPRFLWIRSGTRALPEKDTSCCTPHVARDALAGLLLLVAAATTCSAASSVTNTAVTNQQMVATQVIAAYDAMEKGLLVKLDSGRLNRDEMTKVINALGHIRSTNAIPVLLKNVEFSFGGSNMATPFDEMYPACGALKQIGNISIDKFVEYIGELRPKAGERAVLLTMLAASCHGWSFIERIRRMEKEDPEHAAFWKELLEFFPRTVLENEEKWNKGVK